MKYDKPATEIAEQITLLRNRGLVINDDKKIERYLKGIGYYRLSAYWLPFEKKPKTGKTRSKIFKQGTTFDEVLELYIFDRKLRLLVMEAIERIEVNVRSRWTNLLSLAAGPHAYLDAKNFSSHSKHAELIDKLSKRVEGSRELFHEHYQNKYSEPKLPPLWAVTETMEMGELSKWFAITKNHQIKGKLARELGLPSRETLESSLQVLSYVRNICAHHNRLWNRKLVKRTPTLRKYVESFVSEEVQTEYGIQKQLSNSVYNVLVLICIIISAQSPNSSYKKRLLELLNSVPDKTLPKMGFPIDWKEKNIWVDTVAE